MAVFKGEILFDPLAPATLIVEVHISALLIFLGCELRIFVTLEPGQKILVISPRLLFKLSCRKVLMWCPLLEIKDEQQGVNSKLLEESRIIEDWCGL